MVPLKHIIAILLLEQYKVKVTLIQNPIGIEITLKKKFFFDIKTGYINLQIDN